MHRNWRQNYRLQLQEKKIYLFNFKNEHAPGAKAILQTLIGIEAMT